MLKRQPETVWLKGISSVCLHPALRDQQQAFSHFFCIRAKRTTAPLVPTTGEMRTHKTRHDHTAECFVVYGAEDVKHTEGLMLPLCLKTCNENMQYP